MSDKKNHNLYPEDDATAPPSGGFARLAAAIRNGMEIARFGTLGEREASPFEVFDKGDHHRLRRYFPDELPSDSVPVLLVPPLMMTTEVWDVAPGSSAVTALHQSEADVWVVDFGSPEQEEGGLKRTLTDHVVGVSLAIDAVREATGQSVHVMGYSQGGMFAYQAAAYRRSEDVASLVTFGSGVDLHLGLPSNLPPEMVIESIERLGAFQEAVIPGGIPSWATRLGFQLLDPIKTVQQRVDFVRRLYDREALQKREGMRRFMEVDGWTAFPGPALTDVLKQLVAQNRLLQGGLVIDEQSVTLADITCPILAFVGLSDSIAPPRTVRAIYAAAPQAPSYQAKVPTGHFGLVVGTQSNEITWPVVGAWLEWSRNRGPLPKAVTRLKRQQEKTTTSTPAEEFFAAASLAWDLSVNVVGTATHGIGDRIGTLGRLAKNIVPQLPRLSRLADIRSGTRESIGLAVQRRAIESPDDTFFLFEGRAHSYHAADVRVDNIVRGLLECGVRHGQYVGLYMETRPSAVAATIALSRLGAVAVLFRPDISLSKQLAAARVENLLTDPERGETAYESFGSSVMVLGGGGGARTLASGQVDMEAIDPDKVEVPQWYKPNPGLAGELAIVLITGDENHLGVSRVTNRRWATSAYGTATSCALTPHDTVYCCSPVHHPTGILVCVGGALVSGARLAMATEFTSAINPSVFWQDARRYGVNVVFYSGAMCRAILNAPRTKQERHHSIRLFAGSGMPTGLWHRVVDRFAPASVVEFFASTEGNAVLVNLTGKKVGSLGRPLPGAGVLAVAAWDLERGRLVEDKAGFAGPCETGDVGLLVERVDRERGEVEGRPLRGVFEAGDAWLSTRDLVRVDEDGDYWLVDYIQDVIHGPKGSVPTIAVEDVITTDISFVDTAAVYGVRVEGIEIPVAALTIKRDMKFDPVALRSTVVKQLPANSRPVVIRVINDLPVTAGHRTRKRALRSAGLGLEEASGETLWLEPKQDRYVPFSSDALAALTASLRL
jgi:putative long chain acyl-CoA synthase